MAFVDTDGAYWRDIVDQNFVLAALCARAEARAAGGDLIRKDDKLRLTLPGLTTGDGAHTQDAAQSAD